MAYSVSFGLHACFRPSTRLTSTARRHGFGSLLSVAAPRLSPRKRLSTRTPPAFSPSTGPYRRSLPITLAITGLGLGLFGFAIPPTLHCDAVPPPPSPEHDAVLPPPPQSSVNLYELTFGTVCGVCAGVFVKRGVRMVAFVLGGVFVLLQYLRSLSLVKVDWAGVASRFENLIYKTDKTGRKRPPTVASLLRWMVDFLTADFQARASFIAGLGLGLRVG